jgi:hypothetical protein
MTSLTHLQKEIKIGDQQNMVVSVEDVFVEIGRVLYIWDDISFVINSC